MIKTGYKTVGSRNLTGGMSDALSNVYTMLNANENEKLERERLAKQDARQAQIDAQNKQLFDMKIAESDRLEKARQDEEAYLKQITSPDAYGLKPGSDQLVTALGNYTGGARAEAVLKAGPGTAEYEQYYKDLENFANENLVDQSAEARVLGVAASNPNNMFAQEQAFNVMGARQKALNEEITNVSKNKLNTALKLAEQLGKSGGTGSSSDNAVNEMVSALKGSKVVGYRPMGSVGDLTESEQKKVIAVAQKLDLNPNAVKDLVNASKKDDSTFGIFKDFKIDNVALTKAAQSMKKNEMSKIQSYVTAKGSTGKKSTGGTNTDLAKQLTSMLGGYDTRLRQLQEQKEGRAGLDEFNRQFLSDSSPTSTKVKTKTTQSANKNKKEIIEKVVKKVNTTTGIEKEVDEYIKEIANKNSKKSKETNDTLFESLRTLDSSDLDKAYKEIYQNISELSQKEMADLYNASSDKDKEVLTRIVQKDWYGGVGNMWAGAELAAENIGDAAVNLVRRSGALGAKGYDSLVNWWNEDNIVSNKQKTDVSSLVDRINKTTKNLDNRLNIEDAWDRATGNALKSSKDSKNKKFFERLNAL